MTSHVGLKSWSLMPKTDRLFQLVIAGLTGSGKTTFVDHFLGRKPTFPPTPTMGMDVIVEEINGYSFFIYDLGGHPSFHEKIWNVTIPKADLIIYMIDSATPQLFPFVKENLEMVLQLAKATPVLILANKQDLPFARSIREIHEALDLEVIRRQHENSSMTMLPISALNGQGMPNIFSWIMKTLVGEEYLKTRLTIHGAYVYHREIGLPLGIMFPPKNEEWNAQIDQAALISGFYAAFNSFSQSFMNAHSHSIILRGKDPQDPSDYMFFHCNDPNSKLGILFVTSITNEQMLETVTEKVFIEIKKLKNNDDLNLANSATIIDLYPIITEIFAGHFPNVKIQVDPIMLSMNME